MLLRIGNDEKRMTFELVRSPDGNETTLSILFKTTTVTYVVECI